MNSDKYWPDYDDTPALTPAPVEVETLKKRNIQLNIDLNILEWTAWFESECLPEHV